MLEEAINLIKKQKQMFIVQDRNITNKIDGIIEDKLLENKIRTNINKQIQILDYILEILNKQKK